MNKGQYVELLFENWKRYEKEGDWGSRLVLAHTYDNTGWRIEQHYEDGTTEIAVGPYEGDKLWFTLDEMIEELVLMVAGYIRKERQGW